eukprot:1157888-Pelagomonas_calceolata.AAC.11
MAQRGNLGKQSLIAPRNKTDTPSVNAQTMSLQKSTVPNFQLEVIHPLHDFFTTYSYACFCTLTHSYACTQTCTCTRGAYLPAGGHPEVAQPVTAPVHDSQFPETSTAKVKRRQSGTAKTQFRWTI